MRFSTTRRTALLVAVALAAAWAAGGGGAGASHGVDSPAWIAQAGNGQGLTAPVISNFNLRSALFRNEGLGTGGPRYRAYGTANGTLRTARSNDGVLWQAPQDVMIKDPLGNQTPLVMDDFGAFGTVAYTTGSTPLELYYFNGDDPFDIGSQHRAVSADGVVFELDLPISQAAPPNEVVTGACCASFKSGSLGFTQVIFQTGTLPCSTTAASFPWNCPRVGLYEANDGDLQYVGLAGSIDGLSWAGRTTPALSPGALGSWDDNAATLGNIRRPSGGGFVMYYAGGRLPDSACAGGGIGCWSLGSATSANGVAWTKTTTAPVTPRSLFESFGPNAPHTLLSPIVVDDSVVSGDTHSKIYLARITNAGGRDTFLAYSEPTPPAGPRVRISQPPAQPSCHRALPTNPLAFAADTLGTPAGLNMSTLSVTLNGTPIQSPPYLGSITSANSLVTALQIPAQRIEVIGANIGSGVYTLTFSVEDANAIAGSASVSFQIDQALPSTTVTASPPSPFIRSPGGGIGAYGFTTTDAFPSCGIVRVIARVTNPAAMVKEFNAFFAPSGAGSPLSSTWVAPSLEPHFLLPGPYILNFLGVDKAGNRELPSPANTRTVTVLP